MRSLAAAAALLLAACATTANEPPGQLHGCWIERAARSETATMRWFPDPNRPEVLVGNYLAYPGAGPTFSRTYTLMPGEPPQFCHVPAAGEERCWQVAEGSSGSLEGGRAFIDIHGERMRIAILDGSVERVIFQGARDGCD
jgi:hypothetical protein